MADPGSGTHVNGIRGLIEVKFPVIDKSEQGGRELGMNIVPPGPDDLRPLHGPDDFEEPFPGLFEGPSKRHGLDTVFFICCLSGDTVGRIGAGGELTFPDAEMARSAAGASEKKKGTGEDEENRFHLETLPISF